MVNNVVRLVTPVLPYAASLVSGLFLTLLFAPFNIWPLGWVCLVPFLWAVFSARSGLHAALLGIIFGLAHRLTSLYWIQNVIEAYGGKSWIMSFSTFFLLCLFLALYPASVAIAVKWFQRRLGKHALLLFPFLWVTSEYLQTYILTGVPWNLLGYSQVWFLPAIQFADITGVYGISFLLALVNGAVFFAYVARREWTTSCLASLLATVTIVVFVLAYGFLKSGYSVEPQDKFRVALVQDDLTNAERLNTPPSKLMGYYLDSTRAATARGVDLVLWGEGSLIFLDMIGEGDGEPAGFYEQVILSLVRDENIWLLMGSNDYFDNRTKLYNTALTVSPDNKGRSSGHYAKVHLTPFGEYVPYDWLFGWVGRMVQEISDFQKGEDFTPIPLMGDSVGVAICYEIIFPDLVRRFVDNGAGLLATISNDAWFGPTPANDQHFNMAIMRAVENRRYLLRCAVTGISGIVAPSGEVQARTGMYESTIAYGEAAFVRGKTIYSSIGDAFVISCVFIVILSAAWLRYTAGNASRMLGEYARETKK